MALQAMRTGRSTPGRWEDDQKRILQVFDRTLRIIDWPEKLAFPDLAYHQMMDRFHRRMYGSGVCSPGNIERLRRCRDILITITAGAQPEAPLVLEDFLGQLADYIHEKEMLASEQADDDE